ncbi:MAG: DUF72 domain-containing protein [Candidatus Dormibacteraeota bacterium]|jgi:uncharacterized protein YecE (DUF72 family)|nr:DUF72 domain-containing protein [Candidatus Dormibacteraeota bacterium]
MVARVLVGTCNWSDHRDFYPKGLPARDRLSFYAGVFPLVEVDSSYYAIPPPERTRSWVEATPAEFSFNVKAYRALTYHEREQGVARDPTPAEEQAFLRCLEPLRQLGRLRAVHYQFPPWFRFEPENVNRLALLRDRHPEDLVVVEFRHRSWSHPEHLPRLLDLLREARLSLCVVDEPEIGSGSFPTLLEVTDPRLLVIRFHGRNRTTWYRSGATSADRFDYLYGEDELRAWRAPILELSQEVGQLHVLFNNNRANYAVINGLQMAALLGLAYPRSVPGQQLLPLPERSGPGA